MGVLSIAAARKYLPNTNISDSQLSELLALMEEFAWALLAE